MKRSVVIREYQYDDQGRMIKETVTETVEDVYDEPVKYPGTSTPWCPNPTFPNGPFMTYSPWTLDPHYTSSIPPRAAD